VCAVGVAALTTVVTGAVRTALLISRGLLDGAVPAIRHEFSRWVGLAVATAFAVAVIIFLDRLARRRNSRAVEALLVLASPFLLLAVGSAAYFPEREWIAQGWYVNVGELPLFWGVICGGPIVVVAHVIGRRLERAAA
jgi:hypothetical protein